MSPRGLRSIVVCSWLAWAACTPAPVARAAEPAAPRKVEAVEGITEYRLANGLRILLYPDDSTSRITVNLTVLVGSRHEGLGETGLAHLLEHMLFKGTPTHPDVPRALRDRGAEWNANTWMDRTIYFETLRGTDANLEFAIALEADRLVNSNLKREDLLTEMTVVRNEFEMGENNPESILTQRMWAVAYEWHNYGKSTIGNRSDIERVPIERLQAFYKKYYQPDNAMLIIAGNFDEARALGHIARCFGPLRKPERRLEEPYTEEPAQDGERSVVLRRAGKIGQVGVLYHIPAGAHEDFAAIEVLGQVLTAQPTGRLYQALVASKKASRVSGGALPLHDPGVVGFYSQVDPKNSLEAARDLLVEVTEKTAKEKPTRQEVERAVRKLLTERELLMNDCGRIGVELSEWAAQGDWRLFFLHRDRLAKVIPDDVTRVAKRYLKSTNRTVGMYIPTDSAERSPIPEKPGLAVLLKDFKGGKGIARGEFFDPTPANIEKRMVRQDTPEGVRTAVLPKKSRGEAINAQLTLRYGNEQSLKGLTSAGDLLPTLLTRGTRKHTREQIEDELDRLRARITPKAGLGQMTFAIECKREHLPAVMRLLGEMLREPSFDAAEFEVLKRETHDDLKKTLTDPDALANQTFQGKLNPYPADDVRHVPTLEQALAQFDAVTLEQVKKLYAEQVGGTAGEFVAIGDCTPAGAGKLIRDALKDWKPKVAYRRIPFEAHTGVAADRKTIRTPDKENAVYVAGHALAMTDRDPDYPALIVADFLFGSAALASRLTDRLSQKEGLSYDAHSSFSADPHDRVATFQINAITNPMNIDKVEKAVLEELQRFVDKGVSPTELDQAKKAYLEQLKVQRTQDSQLAALVAAELYAGRTFADCEAMEKKIAGLMEKDVNVAIRKHFQPKKLIQIRAGDFKKAPEK